MKREFYREVEIPEYWIVDIETRTVRVVPLAGGDIVATEHLPWAPRPELPPLMISLPALFHGLRADKD